MKNSLTITLSLAFCLWTFTAQAQMPSVNERPPLTADAPDWVSAMYADKPNVLQVDSLFETFYAKNPKNRNNYIRFYERWQRAAKTRMNPDGFIDVEKLEQQESKTTVEEIARERKTTALQTRSASSWSSFGPHQTYSPGAVVRTYHTNIYGFDVADSDANTLYAGGENSGVWKTTDKGLTWASVGDNFPNESTTAVEIHPTDANIVYACSNRYVHKTTDGGTTWTTSHNATNLGIDDIQIHKTNPNILAIGGDGGMRRTTDGGATLNTSWATVAGMTTWISDIEVNPTTPDEWYCLRKNTTTNLMEFYKSTDAGATWSVRSTGWVTGTTDAGGRMCVTPANDARIYVFLLGTGSLPIIMRSNDKGETWTVLATTLGGMTNGQGYFDLSIAASHTNADWVFAGTTDSYRSVDAGVTWTFVGNSYSGILLHTDLQEVKCVGSDIWTATDGGMSLSTDFFASSTNFSPRNKNLNGFATWGFGQGWQEDVIALSGYHNGTKVMYSGYTERGDNLRIQGGEPATGYVLHGRERTVATSQDGVYKIPTSVSGSFTGLTNLGKYPNEDGYGSDVSEIEFHPSCYKTLYLGKDNAFWKSTDGGTTFAQLYDFGVKPRHFEISRSNPSVIYLATTAALYRSSNGGTAWSAVALPAGCLIYRLSISLSFSDENTLWICSESNANGSKVFKSTNGGASWTNLSTATLNDKKFNQVVHQQGTNGGVYLLGHSGGKAYYRNNSHSDWQDYSANLPAHFENLRAIPFYQKSKIRMGGSRGIWEADFFENSAPIAQPTVDKTTTDCAKNSFYFEDYSVADYNTASWLWSFSPTPQYVSSATVRNPQVIFGAVGNYNVTLTVTDANGTSSKTVTNMVTITTDNCALATTSTSTGTFTGSAASYARTSAAPNFGTSQDFSVGFWFKTTTAAADAVMVTDKNWGSGGYNGWVFAMNSGRVRFNIGDDEGHRIDHYSQYGLNDGKWHHAAASVSRTGNAVFYIDGVSKGSTSAAALLSINSNYPLCFGVDGLYNYPYSGDIDEVKIWNTALTQSQIREKTHLTATNSDLNLIHYYQFNDATTNEYDRGTNGYNLTFSGSASRSNSSAPVGSGTVSTVAVSTGGVKDFTGTNCQIEFPASGTLPSGDVVVSALTVSPDQNPTAGTPLSNLYWIVNNYGTNSTFAALTNIKFSNLGSFANSTASNFKLYKRTSNNHGATWGTLVDAADAFSSTNNNTLTFSTNNNITSFSQFTITNEMSLAVELLDFKAAPQPPKGETVLLSWQVVDEKDVNYYEIERSFDGKTFGFLEKIEKGTFLSQDKTPQYGVNYYRLKIVENDGSTTYSPIRSVDFGSNKKTDFKIYPNPTTDILNVQFNSETTQVIDFELFNAISQLVYSYKLDSRQGGNHLYFKTSNFPKGLYSLRIKQGNVVTVEKVVID